MVDNSLLADDYEQLINWLHERALSPWKIDQLQLELLQRLNKLGFQIYRMHIGMPMLHPLYSIGAYYWKQGEGSSTSSYGRSAWHQDAWLKSPIKPMYEAGESEHRYYLVTPEFEDFPMLVELETEGVTEYFVQIAGFTDRTIPIDRQEGVALTWSTIAPGGFLEEQIRFLSKLRLPLSALIKSLAQSKFTGDILDTYLGGYSGSRVLSGKIKRGDVEPIEAVILFCDLRGSSLLANTYSPSEFLELLNQYYEVTAGAVVDQDGELLRFIGDASLAIFPIEKFESEADACQRALMASEQALFRCEQLNRQRDIAGEPSIRFGIGLHKGEVLYGNIGIPSRLEFTVIGEAANEAARIEELCKTIGKPVLASKTFSECLDIDWVSHGQCSLKNIASKMEVFSPNKKH
ncbi:MAG: adenylate/guanylate cyclase domain-containing protein [Motiliproteus sp.]|nr:adenylate/guanylate cyclase domain-containing protein [Motiliproteus sp.]